MRRCSRCGLDKPPEDYSSVTSGYCKPCARIYRRERYIPVGEEAATRREQDERWRKKHDMKVCSVCRRSGGPDVIFRRLANKRCSDCMSKSLWRCITHGVIRTSRCQKCRYQGQKKRTAEKMAKAFEKKVNQIFLVMGDGRCANCGQMVRMRGHLDRSHRCE